VTVDGAIVGVADAAPRVPCTDDPSVTINARDNYVCGS
jgi:hypothetical protein